MFLFFQKKLQKKNCRKRRRFLFLVEILYLLQELKRKNLITYLKERIENGLLYIGESAGSVIAAPDIEYASIVDDKTLATELNDYTGLNLVDFYIVPHFEEEPFVESSRNTVELYKDKLDLKLINNKEAILVENNNFTIIK